MAEEKKHAYLSASSAARWINCPGSARLAALFPETSSDASQEGTWAHEVAQQLIDYNAGRMTKKEFKALQKTLKTKIDDFYTAHEGLVGNYDTMLRILEPYAAFVWEEYQNIKAADAAAVILTEVKVDFSEFVPDGFGTSDVIIIGNDSIEVIDLKYGKGVPVSAVGNPQIRLYALGAIAEYDLVYSFTKVKMVIYQPRLDSVTEETLTVEDLRGWAQETVAPAAKEAVEEAPACHAGEWCHSHFCPAAARCRTLADHLLALAKYSVTDPELLTDDELGDILPRLDSLQAFARKVTDYVIGAITTGRPVKGWKVIEGRSNRKYKDEDKVAEAVMAAGYDEAMIYERSLLGITKMTSLLGTKKFKEIVEKPGLVYKPPGAPKLAPESDPSPSFDPAAADFDD